MTIEAGIYLKFASFEVGEQPDMWVKVEHLPRVGDELWFNDGSKYPFTESVVHVVCHDAYSEPPQTYLVLQSREESRAQFEAECAREEAAESKAKVEVGADIYMLLEAWYDAPVP